MAAVTAADGDVARINGRWLITSLAGASAQLAPEAMPARRPAPARAAPSGAPRRPGPSDNASSAASAACRPRSERSCSSPSSAVLSWSSRSGCSACASSESRTTASGGSGCSRSEPSPTAGSRATRGTFACCWWRTRDPPSSRSIPVSRLFRKVAERNREIDLAVGNAVARISPRRREARVRSPRRAPALSARHPCEEPAADLGHHRDRRDHQPRSLGRRAENPAEPGAPARQRPLPGRRGARRRERPRDRRAHRAERECLLEPAEPVHRRGRRAIAPLPCCSGSSSPGR